MSDIIKITHSIEILQEMAMKIFLHYSNSPDLRDVDLALLFYRTLSEFWHWFVANVPGDNLDEGEVIFELLFPLVLPEGDGDHR